jgi:hypothetical protein
MPFIQLPGVTGKIYVPEEKPAGEKKHNCKDCHCCQMCSDERCNLCRGKFERGNIPLPPSKGE